MPEPGLLVASAAALAVGCSFVVVGNRLHGRRLDGPTRVAWDLFRGWWYGVGVYVLLAGFLLNGLAAFGLTPLKLFVTVRTLALLVLCMALACLTFYLVFVFRGRLKDLPWIVGFYGGVYAFIVYVFAGLRAVDVRVGAFETRLVYDPSPAPATFALVIALLSLPQVLAAAANLALYRRVEGRSARFRVLMVSGSIALWFLSTLVADLGGPDSPLALARPVFGILAAGCVLAAYAPPAWMQRRLGVDGLAGAAR